MRTHVKRMSVAALPLAVLTLMLAGARTGEVRATKPSPTQAAPGVVNRTESLAVVESRLVHIGEHDFVEFKVKNVGLKSVAIVAFDRYKGAARQDGFQRLSWLTENIETPLLAPGETSTPAMVALEGAQAHVAAVIFDDGTGEGDPAILRRLREQFGFYKEGMRFARARAAALLARVERGEKSPEAAMKELQAELAELGGQTNQPMMSSNGYLAAAAAVRKAAARGKGLAQLREAAADIEKAAR